MWVISKAIPQMATLPKTDEYFRCGNKYGAEIDVAADDETQRDLLELE